MLRLLLIDDNAMLRKALRIALGQMGYAVTEAANGAEALARFREQPVPLVVTDIVMPEKEGLETVRELRALAPQVKIIAMSGGGTGAAGDYLRMAKILGADRVLQKPFSDDDLAAVIRELLGGAGN